MKLMIQKFNANLTIRLLLLFCPVLLLSASRSFCSDSEQNRLILNQRLDSLEVEKQVLKRQGMDISQLEEITLKLRDSLSALREEAPVAKTASKSAFTEQFGFKPRSTFDWIIIAIGSLALLSAILLLLGIIGRARKKKKKHYTFSRKLEPVVEHREFSRPEPELPKYTPGITQSRIKIPESGKLKPQSSEIESEVQPEQDPVYNLRQRISETPPPEDTLGSSSLVADEPITPDSSCHDHPISFNEKVLSAAQEGLSIQEISRRYQISTDQVSLILRVARQKS